MKVFSEDIFKESVRHIWFGKSKNYKEKSIIDSGNYKPPKGMKEKFHWVIQLTRELAHRMWSGTKDLWNNTKKVSALKKKKRNGERLTRQEERFIKQNNKDLRSLIPFFLIWRLPIIGDPLLIFLIARFPGLLPSTFKLHKKPTLEEQVKSRKIKQKSLLDHAKKNEQMFSINDQVSKLIKVNAHISADSIITNAQLMQTSFCLDRLSYSQLAALCSVFGLGTRGPTFFLRYRFNQHLKQLRDDDEMMEEEGVASLSDSELIEACFERGLNVLNLSNKILREQLNEWLRLSLDYPQVLVPFLIYSHGFIQRDFLLISDEIHQELMRETEEQAKQMALNNQ